MRPTLRRALGFVATAPVFPPLRRGLRLLSGPGPSNQSTGVIRLFRAGLVSLVALTTLAAPTVAAAEELTVGVFLPQASFATNAERSAWAERFAGDLTAKANGAFTVKTQLFARREDALAFSGRVDLLVGDGLFALERGGDVIAHATISPGVALYAADAKTVGELAGKAIAAAEAGPAELSFYSNTVLGGELAADKFFGEIKSLKDASAALAAVKSRTVAGAFAPVGHPAAAGLRILAQGGDYPVAVVFIVNKARVEPLRDALLAAITQTPAGPLGSFMQGGGDAFARARGARGTPRVANAPAFLAGGSEARPVAPPIRLKTRGRIPPADVTRTPLARPLLVEPDDV